MAVLESRLKATLIDGVSAAAQRIAASLRGIGASAQGAKGAGFASGMAAQADQAGRSVAALHAKLLAIAGAAYAASRAMQGIVKPTADFETVLLDIAQKSDLSDAAMGQLGERIREMAKDVGRGANDMAKGVDTLLGFGMNQADAMTIMPALGKAASAYNAQLQDLSKAAFSTLDNLKVPANQLGKALDVMAYAGKQGAFEIKDMAAEFPAITAAAQALGITGVEGVAKLTAALQIARKGAATGSESATNLRNIMQKIQAEDAVKKWKKMGVDIRKEVKSIQDQGGDVLEHLAGLINKALKGDLAKLGDLYGDAQVQDFLRPFIQNLEEYKKIRDEARKAVGVVEADYGRRTKTFAFQMQRFKGAMEELSISLGNRVLPHLTRFSDGLSNVLNTLDQRVSIFDHIGKAITGFANGLGFDNIKTAGEAFAAFRDMIFGKVENFEADADRLAVTFKKFQEIGQSLSAFVKGIRDVLSAVSEFVGIDPSALFSFLGTIAGYGAGLAAAGLAIGVLAKSLRSLGKAAMFLTGISALGSIAGTLGKLAGGVAGAGGGVLAGAAVTRTLPLWARALPYIGAAGAGIAAGRGINAVGRIAAGQHYDVKSAEDRASLSDELTRINRDIEGHKARSKNREALDVLIGPLQRRAQEIENRLNAFDQKNVNDRFIPPALGVKPGSVPTMAQPQPTRSEKSIPTLNLVPNAPVPPVRSEEVEKLKAKADEAKASLEALGVTVSPNINAGPVQELLKMVIEIRKQIDAINGGATAAKTAVNGIKPPSATPASGQQADARGRTPFQQAAASLDRSRQTNMTDRNYV